GKTVVQAEIDAAAELIDFFRFNAKHAMELESQQPISTKESTNTTLYRGLEVGTPELSTLLPSNEDLMCPGLVLGLLMGSGFLSVSCQGFIAAVAPFNFTAIGGNLAGTPALMVSPGGQRVTWFCGSPVTRPSPQATRSTEFCASAVCPPTSSSSCPLTVPSDPGSVYVTMATISSSSRTFKRLWKQVAQNLDIYRTFPRLAGGENHLVTVLQILVLLQVLTAVWTFVLAECGGKNFHFVHSSADVQSVVMGTVRSAFEYGGQKCSACSRMYVPDRTWPQIREQLLDVHKNIRVGDVSEGDLWPGPHCLRSVLQGGFSLSMLREETHIKALQLEQNLIERADNFRRSGVPPENLGLQPDITKLQEVFHSLQTDSMKNLLLIQTEKDLFLLQEGDRRGLQSPEERCRELLRER
ncbi:hypothetical protein XENOCAPTIV_015088, partial [Xenoophorus captivus]